MLSCSSFDQRMKLTGTQLTEVKSYPYSFLVQSFLPGNRSGFSGPQRTGSPAQGPRKSGDIEEGVDVKEIDLLLAEMGIMLGRWSLYCRFLARQFLVDSSQSPHLYN